MASKLVDIVGSQVGVPTPSSSTLPTVTQVVDFINQGLRYCVANMIDDALFELTELEKESASAYHGYCSLPDSNEMFRLLKDGIFIQYGGSGSCVQAALGRSGEQEAYEDSDSLQYAETSNPVVWFQDGKIFFLPKSTGTHNIIFYYIKNPPSASVGTLEDGLTIPQYLEDMALDYAVFKSRLVQDEQQEADAAFGKVMQTIQLINSKYSGLHGF